MRCVRIGLHSSRRRLATRLNSDQRPNGFPSMSSQPAPSFPVGEPANAKRRYEVTEADLPLACPLPEMTLWNSHPRIYLPIVDDGGTTVCPYCGAEYVLKRATAPG